jgi:hypothetical protein
MAQIGGWNSAGQAMQALGHAKAIAKYQNDHQETA